MTPAWLVRRDRPDVVSRQFAEAAQRLDRILTVVAAHFDTTPMLLRSHRRERSLAQARFAAVALILELCPVLSLPQIGRALGGRDHTTIIHARQRAAELLQPDWHSEPWRNRYHAARTQLLTGQG
jgi:chromosomal replication initiator protein